MPGDDPAPIGPPSRPPNAIRATMGAPITSALALVYTVPNSRAPR
jgi:hypothetical protein